MIDKKTPTDKDILTEIKQRWSPRAFADKPVENEKLQRVFEAARWAMSSFNEQPWRFVVGIKGQPSYTPVFEVLNEWNQKWAQSAPVLIVVVGKTQFSLDDSNNATWMYDCGAAAGFLCLQAIKEGLYTHQMAGIHHDKAIEGLEIPDGFKPLTAIALGYQGELARIPSDYHEDEKGKRERKALADLVFEGGWSNKTSWI